MNKASQEATTETKQLTISDENISQSDYELLRSGKTVDVDESAHEEKPSGKTVDESDTSKKEASGDDGEDESDIDEGLDEASEEVKPKKKSGTQRRIEKLVKQRSDVERERDFLREQLLRTQGATSKSEVEKPQAAASQAGEPDANDFDSVTAFYSAHAKWAMRQEILAAKQNERQEQHQADADSKAQSFQGKVQEFRKTREDFQDVIESVDDIAMSLAVQHALLESDNGPELMYELAKNPEEYERICSLPAMQAAREIGRFEVRLSLASEAKKTETKKQTTTKAPPPARPISASSSNGKKSIHDDDITQSDYERIRNEQDKRRRGT